MSCIVADAGPLIALAKVGLLELPQRAFGRTLVPSIVLSECMAQARAADVAAIQSAVEAGLLTVTEDVKWPVDRQTPRLDAGELAAIALAMERSAPLLMDEQRGRRAAARLGIPLVGVCGLLVIAKRQGWVGSVRGLLVGLKEAGYYISPALQQQTLALANE
jgi:predicted nucleic acid-binding protein